MDKKEKKSIITKRGTPNLFQNSQSRYPNGIINTIIIQSLLCDGASSKSQSQTTREKAEGQKKDYLIMTKFITVAHNNLLEEILS